jgi:hypothetical protein
MQKNCKLFRVKSNVSCPIVHAQNVCYCFLSFTSQVIPLPFFPFYFVTKIQVGGESRCLAHRPESLFCQCLGLAGSHHVTNCTMHCTVWKTQLGPHFLHSVCLMIYDTDGVDNSQTYILNSIYANGFSEPWFFSLLIWDCEMIFS